jgi:hypothetical protein
MPGTTMDDSVQHGVRGLLSSAIGVIALPTPA